MMARLQEPPNEMRKTQKRQALLLVIVLPIIGGAIIWILNIQGLVTGPWSSIFSVLFTVLGALVALLQWHQQSPTAIPLSPHVQSLSRQGMPQVQLEDTHLGVNRRKGALLVKVKKKLVGSTVDLCCGFDSPATCADVVSNVVVRRVHETPTSVALFPALSPGNYTVVIPATGQRTNVTIQAGQVAEIDWRVRRIKL